MTVTFTTRSEKEYTYYEVTTIRHLSTHTFEIHDRTGVTRIVDVYMVDVRHCVDARISTNQL